MSRTPHLTEVELVEAARRIFASGVEAVEPRRAIRRALAVPARNARLGDRVVVVGAGKAAAEMAAAAEEVLGDRVVGGVVVVKDGHIAELERIELCEAAHPVPDARGEAAAERLLEVVTSRDAGSHVLFLLSGGASALLSLPAEGISLAELGATTDLLLRAGARIEELNAVRKHLSRIQGGQLAVAVAAPMTSLVLSDVVGDPLEAIGSGPTVADSTTFADAMAVLERYRLVDSVPPAVLRHFRAGVAGEVSDTPAADHPCLRDHDVEIVASNRLALDACEEEAKRLGFATRQLSSEIEGEAREVGERFAKMAVEMQRDRAPHSPPECLIAGGETTVTVRGDGRGGRNQELALAAVAALDGVERVALLSCGTDGTDGPTDAAGAVVTGITAGAARDAGLDVPSYLDRNDSYEILDRLDCLVRTGPTGTNVMDVQLILAG